MTKSDKIKALKLYLKLRNLSTPVRLIIDDIIRNAFTIDDKDNNVLEAYQILVSQMVNISSQIMEIADQFNKNMELIPIEPWLEQPTEPPSPHENIIKIATC
jgi:hypothetical protein